MIKKVFLGILVFVLLGIGYLWYIGYLQTVYAILHEAYRPSPSPIIKDEPSNPKKILAHKTSLQELGVTFQTVEGNSADILVPLVGDPNKTGTFNTKYSSKKEEEILLDEVDRKALFDIATQNRLSFHPEYYAMGPSPLDIPNTILPSINTIRKIGRIASSTAIVLENQGKKAEAEKLLQATLVLSRQMEESLSATEIQWLVGIAVETLAAESLVNFYRRNGDPVRVARFENYAKEIAGLKNINSTEFSKLTRIDLAAAVLAGLAYKKEASRAAIRVAYLKLNTTEEEVLNLLNSAKNYDDVPLQGELLLPLTFIRASEGLGIENEIAEKVLKMYAESKNPFIANLAKAGLAVTPQEFKEWIAKNVKEDGDFWNKLSPF